MWWFNVRASNTEPLLRLNVEAADRETMQDVRDELLSLIRSGADAAHAPDEGGSTPAQDAGDAS
jgi:phosphomannomutase